MTAAAVPSPDGVPTTGTVGTPFASRPPALAAADVADALDTIELGAVLERVAALAVGPLGRARIRSRRPTDDVPWIRAELALAGQVAGLFRRGDALLAEPVPDVTRALGRLRIEGSVLEGVELAALAVLLGMGRRVRDDLRRVVELAPDVAALVAEPPARQIERRLEQSVDADGNVLDSASPALAAARREVQTARQRLLRKLDGILRGLESSGEASVTVRNGRYVIPVRRDQRNRPGGIIHDESGSQGTLFIEPSDAVESGNALREAEVAEEREVLRVLRDLTDVLRPETTALRSVLEMCVAVDDTVARARYMVDSPGEVPNVEAAPATLVIHDGRHPLLLAGANPVVPFELDLPSAERTLLVSGPNTGGKTVLLKAVALACAMAQSGIVPPVGAGTSLPVFRRFYADIGDRQSIAASLSTFSAHVRTLGRILSDADDATLVLLDEVGSGTDPAEGGALAAAVLVALTGRGTVTLATTHLGSLKTIAAQVPGVVNASLQFDGVALAPTYRLIKGVPGRSYGIAIARRLSLNEDVIRRAEERLPQQERDMASLIERLEAKETELATREREAETILAEARERMAKVSQRERNVRERERSAERESRKDARRYLLDARAEVERTIKELKRQGTDQADDAGREARRKVEEMAERQGRELERLEREEANLQRSHAKAPVPGALQPPEEGDSVAVASLDGRVGRLLEKRGKEALVAVGEVKMTFPMKSLTRVQPEHGKTPVVWRGDLPEIEVKTEVDVRGHRWDEAEGALLQALDSAIRADLRSLRIIHGKGTGALRELVNEMLRKDTRVKGFRLGAWNEGGTGVTVVDLG